MVDAVGTVSSSTAAAAMKKETGLNKDDFLTLFITQMKNQDPLDPMDSTEFVSQLAQLTQVEQSYNTNANLEKLMEQQGDSNSLAAVSFIGKEIEATGNSFTVTTGKESTLSYSMPSAAENVQILIKNAAGSLVNTVSVGRLPAGSGSFAWNGTDSNGNQLPEGQYQFELSGTGSDGTKIAGVPHVIGLVDGVSLEGDSPVLTVGGATVALADVLSVRK